jgi:hypothetical protein
MPKVDPCEMGKMLRAFLEGFSESPGLTVEEEISPFPGSGIDGFLSHFVFTFQINKGKKAGEIFSYTWPAAIQTVARSEPFIFRGELSNQTARFPLPKDSQLPREITGKDFLTNPPGFFVEGRETIFLQILNLDARGETPYGPMRCILGETFKREYPDIFQPSFGAAQSLNGKGLPGKIFFVPNGIFETPFGALHTRPKNLLGKHITAIPPIGSSPELLEQIPLDSVEELRANRGVLPEVPQATLLALAHPLDAALIGDNLFEKVEQAIGQPLQGKSKSSGKGK